MSYQKLKERMVALDQAVNNSMYFKAVDYIQYVWKTIFNIEHSKSKIKKDLEQGAIQLNGVKLKVDDVFFIDKIESLNK